MTQMTPLRRRMIDDMIQCRLALRKPRRADARAGRSLFTDFRSG
jgi:hypothetical protein